MSHKYGNNGILKNIYGKLFYKELNAIHQLPQIRHLNHEDEVQSQFLVLHIPMDWVQFMNMAKEIKVKEWETNQVKNISADFTLWNQLCPR